MIALVWIPERRIEMAEENAKPHKQIQRKRVRRLPKDQPPFAPDCPECGEHDEPFVKEDGLPVSEKDSKKPA
jgi:hypothetical protein